MVYTLNKQGRVQGWDIEKIIVQIVIYFVISIGSLDMGYALMSNLFTVISFMLLNCLGIDCNCSS
jgi:hypothetical protein